MSRAGYVPQMFSMRLPNPIVIFEMLQKAGGRALVCEPSFEVDLSGCPVPNYPAIQVHEQDVEGIALPPLRTDHSASDLVFILHTSGSTSGIPKLVPCNRHCQFDSVIAKVKRRTDPRSTQGRGVTVAMYGNLRNCLALFFDLTFFIPLIHRGTMCHSGQMLSKRPTLAFFFFSPSVLTGVSLSSVDRLFVPWVVYYPTHIHRILFRRIT